MTQAGRSISIFDRGAFIVPQFVTPAEEERILLRIAEAPWLSELSRRVQHYGYRYDYRGRGSDAPAPAFPRWATCMADRMRAHFGGAVPASASSTSTGRGRASACMPITGTSPAPGPCVSGPAPGRHTPPAACPATKSPCSRAARCWCLPGRPGTAGCTASIGATAPPRPRPGFRRRSARARVDRPIRHNRRRSDIQIGEGGHVPSFPTRPTHKRTRWPTNNPTRRARRGPAQQLHILPGRP